MKYCYDEDIIKYDVLQIETIMSIIYGLKYLYDVQQQRNKHAHEHPHTDF